MMKKVHAIARQKGLYLRTDGRLLVPSTRFEDIMDKIGDTIFLGEDDQDYSEDAPNQKRSRAR